jgi:beta-glucuronidase
MRFTTGWLGICLAALLYSCAPVAAQQSISLDGDGWTFKAPLDKTSIKVSVPHCWPVMSGYQSYIGTAIYDHDFVAPPVNAGQIIRLHFDAVYDVAHVWLNGKLIGTHEGGYTPFEFFIGSQLLPGKNHLTVEVNNAPTLSTTIPTLATARGSIGGRRDSSSPSAADAHIVGWIPYGGIVAPVSLVITKALFIKNVKIDAKPNLQSRTALVDVRAWLQNDGPSMQSVALHGSLAGRQVTFPRVDVPAHSGVVVETQQKLHAPHLWSVADPYLYDARFSLPESEMAVHFGVREVRIEGTQLLLNGKPVHLFGANRVSEDPKEGLRESDSIIARDMNDMLLDNMRMMRIAHYPQRPALLDFADSHGMLIIAEAGNWNLSGWQMADPGLRDLFQRQHKEMMEQDWNHPSVIAWSVGNEYESYTPEGVAWTKDMRSYTLGLDPTRLITFASRFTSDPSVHSGEDEASQYSDFVSVNIYGNYAKRLDRVHELYPNKPIFMTEFGKMGEPTLHDPERIKDITQAVEAVKARPWVIGASLWSWADYRSFFPGTPADGIRRWGVVTFDHQHRDSWSVVQGLFATELP